MRLAWGTVRGSTFGGILSAAAFGQNNLFLFSTEEDIRYEKIH